MDEVNHRPGRWHGPSTSPHAAGDPSRTRTTVESTLAASTAHPATTRGAGTEVRRARATNLAGARALR
ncbi:hypothetical protein DLJ96_19410, partial [Actinotalea fermentans ATCC 43279 = JCM 9966 = DSM 3133]